MSGYREHSFDPNVYERPGPVIRPYNWAQWTGVAITAIGIGMAALLLLGTMGVIPQWIKPSSSPFMLMLVGTSLTNSRRHPGTPITDEQRARNRKMLIVISIAC